MFVDVTRARAWALLTLLVCAPLAGAQTLEIFAGGGRAVDMPGNTIGLQPGALATAGGYLYVNDINGKLMRMDLATGLVTALPATPGGLNYNIGYSYSIATDFADQAHIVSQGKLQRIEEDGTLTIVGDMPYGGPIAFGPDGTLYSVPGDNRVYARRPSGELVILAGGEEAGFSGDEGPASDALLNNPQGIAVSPAGDVYVSDTGNHRVRRIDAVTGVISTVAGTGIYSFNGNGLLATQTNIGSPQGLAIDDSDNLLVASNNAGRILRIDAISQRVSTIGGGGAGGDGGPAINASLRPRLITIARGGDLYLSDWGTSYQKVRKIDASTGIISLVIGFDSFYFCGEDVPARQACLSQPYALDIDEGGNLFIGDIANTRIRKVSASTGHITTFRVTTEAPLGIEHDAAGNIFVASFGGHQVNRYDAVTGAKTVVAGGLGSGSSGDGGPATLARLNAPIDVALDGAANLFITEANNNRVRRVDAATGIISTYATGFNSPGTLEFDAAGDLIVSDRTNCRLKKISTATGAITTIAGTGVCAYQDPPGGTLATATPIGINASFAIAPNGEIFLGWQSRIIYRIDPMTGIMTRVAGPANGLATVEGVQIYKASKMEFDAWGNLYISQDTAPNNYIFKVSGLFDTSPPDISAFVSGLASIDDWYRSNVTVSWVVSDPQTTIWSNSGCATSVVSEDTAGVTFTCSATSGGGMASKSVTVRRDTVAPTLTFGEASPAADASGWRPGPVSVPFEASDELSGVYVTSSTSPVAISGSGSGLTAQVTVVDRAGNYATFTTEPFNVDSSAPVIVPSVSGGVGTNGWYTTDVHLDWSVTEPESGISSRAGCESSSVTSDTSGITFTCSATSAGGTSSKSVTLKRDATPPVLVFGAPSPAADASGWNTGDVTIPFSTQDSMSGVYSVTHPSPTVIGGDGAGLTAQETVTDNAGNSATFSTPVINIDRLPATVQASVSGTIGNNGWYTSDVQVSWAINKPASSILASSGCETANVVTDTAGITFTCSVTSGSGTAGSSVTIKRDATPPELTFGSPSPVPNTNGWNKTNVSIPFTRSDALSGLASTSIPSPLVLSTEGANVTGQVEVTDNAGNHATFTSVARNIDKVAPYAEIESPADNGTYGFYQDVVADYVCTDTSLLSCTAPTPLGQLINTATAGARTFKVTSKDAVGFTTTHVHAFTVESWLNFAGFAGPVALPPTLNLVTRGALVPIRWQLPDGRGGFVTNPASFTSATVGSLSCGGAPSVPLGNTDGGPAGIRYDAASNSFVYNWQTSASWTGCRKLTLKLKDGSLHELRFKFQ